MPSSRQGVELGEAALLFGIHDQRTLPALPRVTSMIQAVLMVLVALTSALTATQRATVDRTLAPDVVSVYTARQLDDNIAQRAITAAEQAGGAGVELNGGVLGLLAVRRAGQPVQRRRPGTAGRCRRR